MKIALVHDYLKEMGGAEKVLRVLSDMYPEAPIYTAFVDPKSGAAKEFADRKIIESKWGVLLKIGKMYSYLRFCLPWVWQSLDLSQYDLVITSCSGYIARGFVVGKTTKVVAYCHTPPRWLYGYETPTGAQGVWWGKIYLWLVGPFVRYFDFTSAQRVDKWIANSREVVLRINKFYRKEAVVVYPPCDTSPRLHVSTSTRDYWLIVSRIVGGKGLELAVQAAREAKEKLVIVGMGDNRLGDRLQVIGNRYVEMKGWVEDSEISEVYAGAKGFLALAKDEDFGMSVVEAMAYGVPVLAYNGGGFKETVIEGVNGRLINDDVSGAMNTWGSKWDQEKIIESVAKFGKTRFEKEVRKIVESL
ncbi:MAG: glycosyltransferase [bacterium]